MKKVLYAESYKIITDSEGDTQYHFSIRIKGREYSGLSTQSKRDAKKNAWLNRRLQHPNRTQELMRSVGLIQSIVGDN